MRKILKLRKKCIYVFLALTVILSGICFGASSGEYKWQQSTASGSCVFQLRDSVYGGNEICTGDLLGHKSIDIQENQLSNSGSDLKVNIRIDTEAAVMLYAVLFLYCVFMRKEYLCIEKRVNSRRVIIRYIHHQDGEKSILS